MPDTLTSFLHLNCTSIPHGGALCTSILQIGKLSNLLKLTQELRRI